MLLEGGAYLIHVCKQGRHESAEWLKPVAIETIIFCNVSFNVKLYFSISGKATIHTVTHESMNYHSTMTGNALNFLVGYIAANAMHIIYDT